MASVGINDRMQPSIAKQMIGAVRATSTRPLARAYAIGTAALIAIGLTLQLYVLVAARIGAGRRVIGAIIEFFGYFTILTNILAGLALFLPLWRHRTAITPFFTLNSVNTGIAVNIVLVDAFYSLLLRHLWRPTPVQQVADILLHDLVPPLFVLYWWLFLPRGQFAWRELWRWLAYPLGYFVYMLLLGLITGHYPYPFFNVAQVGYGEVLLNAGLMLPAFVGCGALLIGLDRRKTATLLRNPE
jgi:hypothetical protein